VASVATLALRLEDFLIDPFKEFSKIVQVVAVDLDLSRSRAAPPRTDKEKPSIQKLHQWAE
jgi:hypothetical protein